MFNPLFMEVLRINKWIHELDSQKGRVQIYAGMKIGNLIVPLTAFIAYLKKSNFFISASS